MKTSKYPEGQNTYVLKKVDLIAPVSEICQNIGMQALETKVL